MADIAYLDIDIVSNIMADIAGRLTAGSWVREGLLLFRWNILWVVGRGKNLWCVHRQLDEWASNTVTYKMGLHYTLFRVYWSLVFGSCMWYVVNVAVSYIGIWLLDSAHWSLHLCWDLTADPKLTGIYDSCSLYFPKTNSYPACVTFVKSLSNNLLL